MKYLKLVNTSIIDKEVVLVNYNQIEVLEYQIQNNSAQINLRLCSGRVFYITMRFQEELENIAQLIENGLEWKCHSIIEQKP